MPEDMAYFGGRFIPLSEAKVGIMTHALHYGTAVFEGIRGNWNEEEGKIFIFRQREHYERLLQGCRMLKMEIPHSVDDLCNITAELVERCGYQQDLYIRPIAFKSSQLVANLKLHEVDDDFALMTVPFGSYIDAEGAIRCCTSSWRRVEDTMIPPLVKISGLYINSILAKTEAVTAGFDEAILLNQDGHVSEGSGENIFLVHKGTLHTPATTDNILPGITKDTTIQLAQGDLGLKVTERAIRRSELYLADEIFLTGTAAHITPVGEIDNRNIGDGKPGPITQALQKLYFDVITGRNPKYLHWCTPVPVKVAAA